MGPNSKHSFAQPMGGFLSGPKSAAEQSTMRKHFIAATGEFVGTFLFLFFAFLGHSMSVNQAPAMAPNGGNSNQTVIYIAMSYGFSLLVTAWTLYRVSGGLFNPAVTIGMIVTGTLPTVRGLILIPVQFIGAMCAAGVAAAIIPGDISVVQTTLAPEMNIAQGLFLEMFLTSQLVFTILMLAAEKSKDTFMAPIGIGLALFVVEIAGVYYTGASVNPARSFGPCVAGANFQGYHWIYWLGPVLGALIAAGYYHFVKYMNYEDANPGQDSADGAFDPEVEREESHGGSVEMGEVERGQANGQTNGQAGTGAYGGTVPFAIARSTLPSKITWRASDVSILREQLPQLLAFSPIRTLSQEYKPKIPLGMPEDAPQRGLLLLASRILDDSAALTGPAFARWGEETCVPSVQATGGVSHTLRYESLDFLKQHRSTNEKAAGRGQQPKNMNCPYDFLDLYFMPDINFSESDAFRQLPIVGDAEITGDMDASKLLERLLMQTEFQMRLCAAAESEASSISTTTPAPFLVTVAAPRGQLPTWVDTIGKFMGRYHVQSTSTLGAMERSQPSATLHDEIALVGCNSLRSFEAAAGEESGSDLEIGLWGLRKHFSGNERQPAVWRPGVRI